MSKAVNVSSEDISCPNPNGSFVYSPSKPTSYDVIYFDASASNPGTGRTIDRYEWYIDDVLSKDGSFVIMNFSPGSYIVKLVVTNDCGKTDTTPTTKVVKVIEPPNGNGNGTPPIEGTGIWDIKQAVDSVGSNIFVSKVYVDDVYVGGYTPEVLYFGSNENYSFGSHTVKVEAEYSTKKYKTWSQTRDIQSGDMFEDFPVLAQLFLVDIISDPLGAIISTNEASQNLNLISLLYNKIRNL
uniref:PKD domain-containing protein n=1 Tax=viral metagenome TaxID=1070528 RepID=A0A6M3MGA7_9ZZZZ